MNFFNSQYHHQSFIFISIGLGLTFTPKELIQLQTYFMKYSKTVLIASIPNYQLPPYWLLFAFETGFYGKKNHSVHDF